MAATTGVAAGGSPGARAADSGRHEAATALRQCRGLILAVALFGAFVNVLMLTGPLFMLQVYDRVLGSGSRETLVALILLVAFLFAMMGVLDHTRGRIMARVAARLRVTLEPRIFCATLSGRGPGMLSALDALQRLIGGPALLALLDLPWMPVFLIGIFLFHPWLGGLALAGGAGLVALALLNQMLTAAPTRRAAAAAEEAGRTAGAFAAASGTVRGLGMAGSARARWSRLRAAALAAETEAGDIAGGFAAAIRATRLLLQSAMLALGAWLVLAGELTAGAMVAASVLLGRALAPVEQAVAQWSVVRQGAGAWRMLGRTLAESLPEPRRTALPRPAARLEVENLTLLPPGPGAPVLRMLSFTLEPGQALGLIGPSGAGKSALAQALAGLWPAAAGRVRLGGVPLGHYAPERLGRLIGYLPQRVILFEGTIAENIARLDPAAEDGAITAAARAAGAERMIHNLPQGYDTRLAADGAPLSGGQIQRIGLARALYGDPVLLILDEPDSSLDHAGTAALNAALRAARDAGKAVVVAAHRPATIRECDRLLVLDRGRQVAFGPHGQVLHLRGDEDDAPARRTGAPGGAG